MNAIILLLIIHDLLPSAHVLSNLYIKFFSNERAFNVNNSFRKRIKISIRIELHLVSINRLMNEQIVKMSLLCGKTVINVGGAGGIGFEISKQLLAAGVEVVNTFHEK